jgi:hypothetical protein
MNGGFQLHYEFSDGARDAPPAPVPLIGDWRHRPIGFSAESRNRDHYSGHMRDSFHFSSPGKRYRMHYCPLYWMAPDPLCFILHGVNSQSKPLKNRNSDGDSLNAGILMGKNLQLVKYQCLADDPR